MRLPFEPLIITTSPARTPRDERVADIAGALAPGRRAARRARRRKARASAARRRTADRPGLWRVRRERGVHRRALGSEFQHVADDGDAPAARPGLGRAQQRERRAHRGRIGVVAFVDDVKGPLGAGSAIRSPRPFCGANRPAPPRRPRPRRRAPRRRASAPSAFSAMCRPGAPSVKVDLAARDDRRRTAEPVSPGSKLTSRASQPSLAPKLRTSQPARARPRRRAGRIAARRD